MPISVKFTMLCKQVHSVNIIKLQIRKMICIKPPTPLRNKITGLTIIHFAFVVVVIPLKPERVYRCNLVRIQKYNTFAVYCPFWAFLLYLIFVSMSTMKIQARLPKKSGLLV